MMNLKKRFNFCFPLPFFTTQTKLYSGANQSKTYATLYIHWPYCQKRCTYCNFNKYISKTVDNNRMTKCLVRETETLLRLSGVTKIQSVFFGGGTPSLADARTVSSVLNCVRVNTDFDSQAEVSIEVNPTIAESGKLSEFKVAGVNRVSLGLQSLNDEDLKVFGRNHSVSEGLRCLEEAKKLFPGKTSCDVIYGRPGQTLGQWQAELDRLTELVDDHVSLYQLTLERGTALFKMVMNREVMMPERDLMADLYEAAVTTLRAKGFSRYEVSNFARTKDAECSHNKSYWDGTSYIGVGPGAHARFTPEGSALREARVQTLEPDNWMYEVEKYGHATRKRAPLSPRAVMEELLIVGLRTAAGISEESWSRLSGVGTLADVFSDTHMGRLLQAEGFIEFDHRGLRATDRGLNVADSVTSELLTILEKHCDIHDVT